jgi:hypothetical protein
MQNRASEYPRGDARTLPRRPLAPTQRRIPAPTYGGASGVTEMDATTPMPRVRADSAARALSSYSGASAMGAPTMTPPLTTSNTESGGMGQATVAPGRQAVPYLPPSVALAPEPEVWLIALATPGGGLRPLEGAARAGAIRVGRPYGHLRAIRPVLPPHVLAAGQSDDLGATAQAAPTRSAASRMRRRSLGSGVLTVEDSVTVERAATSSNKLPAERPKPQIISAVEVETDAGVFRVERPDSVLDHSDLAWAMAHLEAGEPDALVPLPRRQLALLLTLLPTPEDPNQPEQDSQWGWAHRLKAPWERGPLHAQGRLGRLIAVDADLSSRGMHRACFEMLGTEEVVWALGVPCYRTGSVYELTPLRRGIRGSRWLTWPLPKGRAATGSAERPTWEIARVVYRVGAPRWPLAGIVEPLGPMGVAG